MANKRKHKQRKIQTTALRRIAFWDRETVDMDARTVQLAFSSEQPVSRWFGEEILDHSKGSVRLDRLRSTGPLLLNHDSREHIGTIESASIGKDRVGRAVVRFGQGAERDAILQDITDGIRKCVSVGYRIHRMKLEEASDDSPDIYRATDWEPYEVSLVSMPADTSVGVGREAREWHGEGGEEHDTIIIDLEDKKMSGENEPKLSRSKKRRQREGATAERTRINLIREVGAKYNQSELADKCIEDETSLEDFNRQVLDSLPGAQSYTPETRSDSTFGLIGDINRVTTKPASDWKDQDGNAVTVLRGDESLSKRLIQSGEIPVEQRGLDIGVAVCALITGRYPDDGILQRALGSGSDAAGGYHLTPILSSQIIDLARKQSILMQAGATVILMDSSELAIVKVLTDPVVGFVAENADISLTETSFGRVTFRARKLSARIAISFELLQDAPNAAEEVRAQLGKVLGLALDLSALKGTGAGEEIVGIFSQPDVQEISSVGSPTYDHILDAVELIENENGVPAAYLITPDTKNTLSKIKDSAGNYLTVPKGVSELNRFVTRQLSNAEACVGDFSQVMFGVRSDVTIEISTEGGDAWKKDQVEIKIRWRGDSQLAQAKHLVKLTGIT